MITVISTGQPGGNPLKCNHNLPGGNPLNGNPPGSIMPDYIDSCQPPSFRSLRPVTLTTFILATVILSTISLFWLPEPVKGSFQQQQDPPATAAVVTAEEIRESGITRLHELFTLFDNWTGYNINGQEWETAVAGLTVYEDAGWSVMIDNQPVILTTLGWQSFNQLPVTLQEIHKVIVIDIPQLYHGIYTGRGLIHIITRRESTGWQADVRFAAGNEINDPGPYEFTELASPNEERTGPDLDVVLGRHADRWFIQGSGSVMRHRSTDIPVERRIKDMLFTGSEFESPANLKKTVHLQSGYRDSVLDLNIQGGSTDYRDFPFLRPYGREVPVQFQNRYGGIDAAVRPGDALSVSVRTTFNERMPDFSPNRVNHHFDFRQKDISSHIGVKRDHENRQQSAGMLLEQSGAAGDFDNDPGWIRIWTLYTQWIEKLSGSLSLTGDLRLALDGADRHKQARTAAVRADWRVSEHHTLKPYLSRSEELAAEIRNLWFWKEAGYRGISSLEIDIDPLPERRTGQLTAAGLHWIFRDPDLFTFYLHGYVNRRTGSFLSRQSYSMVQPHQWFEHDGVRFFPDENATTAGFNLKIRFDSFHRVSHTLFLGTRRIAGGTEEMKKALDEIPDRRLRFSTSWTAADGFQLWSTLRLQSETVWHEFEDVHGTVYADQQQLAEGVYRNRTAVRHLDIGGRKSLWGERLHLDLIVKNLLNQPYVHHPAGTDNDLTFYVQIGMSL